MLDRLALVGFTGTAITYLTPQRMWVERLALIVPAPDASRWLLIVDIVCLLAIVLSSTRLRIAVPLALGLVFLAVNVAGMVLTDFYLGLAVVHLAAGTAAVVLARDRRWIGVAALCLALGLGVLT
jgi:hypothetical protein